MLSLIGFFVSLDAVMESAVPTITAKTATIPTMTKNGFCISILREVKQSLVGLFRPDQAACKFTSCTFATCRPSISISSKTSARSHFMDLILPASSENGSFGVITR